MATNTSNCSEASAHAFADAGSHVAAAAATLIRRRRRPRRLRNAARPSRSPLLLSSSQLSRRSLRRSSLVEARALRRSRVYVSLMRSHLRECGRVARGRRRWYSGIGKEETVSLFEQHDAAPHVGCRAATDPLPLRAALSTARFCQSSETRRWRFTFYHYK